MLRSLLVTLVVLAAPAYAQRFGGAKNMRLFDHLNPVDSVGSHAAIWGYVAPNGREYAFVGSQIGTHIIDVTEFPIREVQYIWGPYSKWREMKTRGEYLYIVSEAKEEGSGLQIVDLRSLPAGASLVRTDTTHFKSAHTVYIRDRYLYAMGTARDAGANGGVIILDLEPDPVHPRFAGRVDRTYYHDAWERGDTLVGANVYGGGIDMFDIRDKANPIHLANINYPYSGTHNVEITSDGGYLVSSDEIGFTPKTMKVWDIRDLQNVRMVAEYTHNIFDVVHNVHVNGRYVVAAWYTGGVRIIDMIDPEHPREVAYYDTYPGPSGGFDGVWEAFSWLPSGKVLIGDRNTGLYVAHWDRKVAGSVSGTIRNAANNQPLAGVAVRVPHLDTVHYTGSDGKYYIGAVVGDTISFSLEKFGYAGRSQSMTIDRDHALDLTMTPLTFATATIVVTDESGAPVTDFSYAVEPHVTAQVASGSSAQVMLPIDSTFTLTVGRWGSRVVEMPITLRLLSETINVRLERGYHDNFTLDLGWSLRAADDSATTGNWVRIVPYLGYPQSIWIHPSAQPGARHGRVVMTGAPPINAAPQENDVNAGTVTLTSPLMDLRDHADPVLSFDLWFVHYPNYRSDTTLAIDSLTVDISNDDGGTWVRIHSEVRGRGMAWSPRRFTLRPFIEMSDRMRMRVQVRDVDEPTTMFAAIDNFEVARTPHQSAVRADGHRRTMRLQVLPSPASHEAFAHLDVEQSMPVRIDIFDARGLHVAALFNGTIENALRVRIPSLPTGAYRIRAIAADGSSQPAISSSFVVVQ